MTLIHLFLFSKTILFALPFSFSSREKCSPNQSEIESEKSATQRFESEDASCRTSISLSQKSTRSILQLTYLSRQPPYQINIKLFKRVSDGNRCIPTGIPFTFLENLSISSISHCFSSREHQRRRREKQPKRQQPWRHFPRRWPWRFQEWPCTPQVW